MAFLKALTIFLVCISIFGVIISESTLCRYNITQRKKCNVLLTGNIECPSCQKYGYSDGYVIVNLEERHVIEHINVYCNRTFGIKRYLDNPGIKDYNASFYLSCGVRHIEATVENLWPKDIKIGTFSVYDFGKISFSTPEQENIVREEKVLENTFFE